MRRIISLVTSLVCFACKPIPIAEVPCVTASDCPSGSICVRTSTTSVCKATCPPSIDACGVGTTCTSLGIPSINVCLSAGTQDVRIPCRNDSECRAYKDQTLCAEQDGHKTCTVECEREADCDAPAPLGPFYCRADDSDESRRACSASPEPEDAGLDANATDAAAQDADSAQSDGN